jgi:hypothetical protein
MILSIVDTGLEFRVWQEADPEPLPSAKLTTQQNDHNDADVMFYRQYFGAGGEKGLGTHETHDDLKGRGITFRRIALGQHDQIGKKCRAVLYHGMHCIDEQLAQKGTQATFPQLLAEAVFVDNVPVPQKEATPSDVQFGCRPAMHPDLHAVPTDTQVEPGRNLRQMRTLDLARTIGGTAIARTSRAMRERTSAPGEVPELALGELVESMDFNVLVHGVGVSATGPYHISLNLIMMYLKLSLQQEFGTS